MAITSIANVSEDALNAKNLLDNVLETIITIFDSYNVPLPNRRYWNVGQVAIDCEQLSVSLIQIYLGPPGDQASMPQRCNMPRTAVMMITLAREIPVVGMNGRPPSPEKISEGAEISAVDAWVLMESLNALDQWEPGTFGVGTIATVDIPPPEGGFQLVTMQLTMAIP
jgi:hypothetical protein